MTRLHSLCVNYMSEPLGIDGPFTFGWKMESDIIGQKQTACKVDVYEGESLVWTSGKLEGADNSVSCDFEAKDQTRYTWSVTAWDKNGNDISERSAFETGVTENEDWKKAEFICMPNSSAAPIFRTERPLKGDVIKARLYITAVGVYSAMVNGVKVYKLENGEKVYHHMNPGYTDGARFITYEAYDVTEALKEQSAAVVSVTAGTGWANANGDGILGQSIGQPAVKAMLFIEYTDGSQENVITEPEGWFGTLEGPVTANGVYYGEDYDARRSEALGEYWLPECDVSLWQSGGNKEATNVITNEFEPVAARYIRFSITETGPATANDRENRLQIMELEAFDEKGGNAAMGGSVSASDSFEYGAQWRAVNLTDGDDGRRSDSGYTSNILGKNGDSSFRLASPIVLTVDLGKTAVIGSTKIHCRVRQASVLENVCPDYPEEYSIFVSPNGEDWTEIVTNYRPQNVKTGSDGLSTLKYNGKIAAAKGMSGRIVDEFEQRPVSVVLYTGVKESSSYIGGEIEVDGEYPSLGGGVTLKKGQTMVVNMGQNLTAVPEIKVVGERGTTVQMKFAEMLNDGSKVGSGAFDASGPKGSIYTHSLRKARSEARYTLSGDGEEVYQPSMSFFGYQYVQITADNDVTITSLRSRALSSVSKRTGDIKTNNPDVNRLFLNALYGQLSNYFTVPTDCPQRDERLAWTGDAQAFAKTALYNFDSFAFLNGYQDMLSENTLIDGFPAAVVSLSGYFYHWAMGWSDVEVINDYMLYTMSKDTSVIENHWEALSTYMDYMEKHERAPHQAPNPDKWAYGDWLAFQGTGYEVIADLYYGYVTSLMAEMAKAVGKTEEAEHYLQKFDAQKEAFLKAHVIYSPEGDATPISAPTLEKNVLSLSLPKAQARYVRLAVEETGPGTSDDNEYRLQIMEISISDGGEKNLALGKNAFSNNDFNNYGWVMKNLTDGDPNTGYSSKNNGTNVLSDPIYVTVDLGEEHSIDRVDIVCRIKNETMSKGICPNFPKRFSVELSRDGESWERAAKYLAKQAGESFLTVKSSVCRTDKIFAWHKIGSLEDNSQTALIWMLKLGWYENEDMKNEAIRLLVENIKNESPAPESIRAKSGRNTLSVGFLGSNVIAPVLSQIGKPSVSYDLLLNTDMPSWLFEVRAGATTVWERWNSYDPENGFGDSEMNSFNHFAYGSVAEWMYEYMAGISTDGAGFEHIILRPTPDEGEQYNDEERIREVTGKYNSRRGLICSQWKADEKGRLVSYSAELPANTSATLYLPVEASAAERFVDISGVTFEGMEEHNGLCCAKFELESGGYDFVMENGALIAFVKTGYVAACVPKPRIRLVSAKMENNTLSYEIYSSFENSDIYAALYNGDKLVEVKKNQLDGEFINCPEGCTLKVVAWEKCTLEPMSGVLVKSF